VGLATARAAAARGLSVCLVHTPRAGEASRIGAGMLAASVERAEGAAQRFLAGARDAYPAYAAELTAESGLDVSVVLDGILQVPADDVEAEALRAALPAGSQWLAAREIEGLDAWYVAPHGGAWHPRDGAVDPVPLMDALELVVARQPRVTRMTARVSRRVSGGVELADGTRLLGGTTVLASGAWSGVLDGLPRRIPVRPVRGQMLELANAPARLVAYGAGGYLVPRPDGRTYVGATMEDVGFAPGTTEEGSAYLLGVAATLVPALKGASPVRHAAALRPMTPDHLPIIGPEPEDPSLWYACGHGRNGILAGPLTGHVVATALWGDPPTFDLSPFDPARFG
jgi:glycine oxidase